MSPFCNMMISSSYNRLIIKTLKRAFLNSCSYLHTCIYKPPSIFKTYGGPNYFSGAALHTTSVSIDRKWEVTIYQDNGVTPWPRWASFQQTLNNITQTTAFLAIWFKNFFNIFSYEKLTLHCGPTLPLRNHDLNS